MLGVVVERSWVFVCALGLQGEEPGHEHIVDGKGCGCWKARGRGEAKEDKGVQEGWEREWEMYFRKPQSAHWPRRTFLQWYFSVLGVAACLLARQRRRGQRQRSVPREGGKDRVLPGWSGQL